MPNKKKMSNSGYAIFVQETRDLYRNKGWHFPKNNQDAFTFVSPLWKKLSEEEQQKYKELAKKIKRHDASELESKFNSDGVSYADIRAAERDKEESRGIMLKTIYNTVNQSDFNTTFKTQKFYTCHINFFYVNDDGKFKPAEIALSEFNLKEGLCSTFHAFIDPGPIELGYRYEAKRKSDETHQIPIKDPEQIRGENNYAKLFIDIKTFLCKGNTSGRVPPIYTMPDDEKNNYSITAVQSTVETLCEACNEDPDEFRIYELPHLYHELRRKAMTESPIKPNPEGAQALTLSTALHDLEKDTFCYTKGIACQFHELKDLGNFCSLSTVTRFVYTMCDYLLNYVDEELVEGGHVPKGSIPVNRLYHKNEDTLETMPLRKPRLPLLTNRVESCASSQRPPSGSGPAVPHSAPTTSQSPPAYPQATSSVSSYASVISGGSAASKHSVLPTFQGHPPPPQIQEEEDPPSSVYEDTYHSTSSSQSSYSADMSIGGVQYLGRGRRPLKPQAADTSNTGYTLNAGRGSRLRPNTQ